MEKEDWGKGKREREGEGTKDKGGEEGKGRDGRGGMGVEGRRLLKNWSLELCRSARLLLKKLFLCF